MRSLIAENTATETADGAGSQDAVAEPLVRHVERGTRKYLYWASVPVLAITAYITVLGIGFMDDDYNLLYLAHRPGVDWRALLPGSQWFFYRPVGVLLTWELGWDLWGLNPAPYHAVGLALHAAISLALGLWLATLSGWRSLGWLAGTLFAVFPLHLEAVGWVATQWDLWATLFGLLSLWGYTVWWQGSRRGGRSQLLYVGSVLSHGLAIFAKESMLTFLPVLGMSAWLAAPPRSRTERLRLLFSLVPFAGFVGLNVALRLFVLADLGNYRPITGDFELFFWDHFVAYLRPLLSPINSDVLGVVVAQAVGALSTIGLVLGLIWYGRSRRSLIFLAAVWVFLTILPVLGIPGVRGSDLLQNRYLYLIAAGYCVCVATLLHALISSGGRARRVASAFVALLVPLALTTCWLQLRPWHTATAGVNSVVGELLRMIPSQPRPDGLVWYVENVPEEYKGAYMLRRGLGLSRLLLNRGIEYPRVERVADATKAPLTADDRDAYAIRFRQESNPVAFSVEYVAGVTAGTEPPAPPNGVNTPLLWDFRKCAPSDLQRWSVLGARSRCEAGEGLALEPTGNDPMIIGPPLEARLSGPDVRFLRVRAAVRYAKDEGSESYVSEWFWETPVRGFSGERRISMPTNSDGNAHVYWTFIPASLPARAGEKAITRLRFDPINAQIASTIKWIAVDPAR